jgi:glycosidase
VKIILGIEVNHVSLEHPWFKSSAAKNSTYADFFVWKGNGAEKGADGKPKPPNNWVINLF